LEVVKMLGVDLSTEPRKTAACWLHFGPNGATVDLVTESLDDDLLVELLATADRAAIDSPLGWPEPFIEAITQWRDTGTFPGGTRTPLRMRATDLYVQERALTPFSVSADRLGAVAMRCSLLLSKVTQRTGEGMNRIDGRVIECYPSAALYRFGFDRSEVRGAKTDVDVRARLLAGILAQAIWLALTDDEQETLVEVGDSFDAFVAALVARAAALGLTDPAPPELTVARSEGWIHLPVPNALTRLSPGCAKVAPRRKGGKAPARTS
jgi:predicted nuclease with RNAse H fold